MICVMTSYQVTQLPGRVRHNVKVLCENNFVKHCTADIMPSSALKLNSDNYYMDKTAKETINLMK